MTKQDHVDLIDLDDALLDRSTLPYGNPHFIVRNPDPTNLDRRASGDHFD
ncbi:hypothetical protein [Nocardia sp. CNY236]|nr:hypothetical protein [Nocardia sp. CNY236]